MKKKRLTVWIVLVLIVGIFVAWRIGYSARKSNDNLPALTSIAQMSEAEVNNVLPGYKITQLREVWGEPDQSEGSTDIWKTGNVTLVVNYKNNGVVSICGLKDANGMSVGEE